MNAALALVLLLTQDAELQKMQQVLKTDLTRLNAAFQREKIDAVDPKAKPTASGGTAQK